MSTIPSNLSRVPNMLASQIMLGTLHRTGQSLLNTQIQLATGRAINRASDNPVGASTISVLDDAIERRTQRIRNLTHGEAVLNNVEAALAHATEMMLEAKSIGLSQIGAGSDADTRALQAVVIDSMINEMVGVANRKYQQTYLFGGGLTSKPPMVGLHGGWLYQGFGEGLFTDLGFGMSTPITVSGRHAFGAVSARVVGERDLNPVMTGQTRLQDLNGARGLGVSLSSINVTVDGTELTVDLTDAFRVQDVIDRLNTAIQAVDPDAVVDINPAGNGLRITPGAGIDITITDLVGESTAADLGIHTTFPGGVATSGQDVNPRLTKMTPLANLSGVTVPLGTIRIANGNQVRELDLSGAETVQDVMSMVASLQIGVSVEINEAGDRLNFVNHLSGASMSVGEVNGGTTATQLGIRSMGGSTLLESFNNGRGVQIRTGSVDPVTGLPNPAADIDFRVTLKDGRSFEVDLAGAITVQDVLDKINQAADLAGIDPADFEARLATHGNGLALVDNTLPIGGTTTVEALNGSFAAEDLGILGSTTSAILAGEDRATVAVDSVITHLMALRDALYANDERGISFATKKLESGIDRLALTRAEVGARTRRITDAMAREEDLLIQDMSLRSQVQDLDYTEAALRFATLQQQLQAGLQTASRVTSLSLLDFLR